MNKKGPASTLDGEALLTLDRLHLFSAVAVMAVGTLVLFGGYALGVEFLRGDFPGFATIKVNTSLNLILSGLSLCLWRGETAASRRAASGIGASVALLGAANLAQYLWGVDLGIDQLLFPDPLSPFTSHPGRMSSNTAFSFLFFGAALALLPAAAAESCTVAALLLPLMAGAGYLHHAGDFAAFLSTTGMAPFTLAAFLLLGMGIFAARPRWGGVAWLVSRGPDGPLVRRYLPLAVLMLFGVALLAQAALNAKLLTEQSRGALALFTSCVAIAALILSAARSVAEVDHERKAAEQALRESEQRLSLALSATGGGIWEWDLAERSAWWSPEMHALWGTDTGAGALDFASALEMVHPEDRERLRHDVEEAINGSGEFHCEFRLRHPLRGERWLASHGRALRHAAGRALRLHGITEDVSERRQAEEALHAAHEELETRVGERTRMLSEAQAVLKELNETLEQRIEERTAALIVANSELQESRSLALEVMTDALGARKQAEEAGNELLRSNRRLDFLARSAKRLLASESPQELVEELCHDLLRVLDCHAFFYFLLDPDTDRLHLLACSGIAEEQKRKIASLDPDSIMGGRDVGQRRRVVTDGVCASRWPVAAVAQEAGIRAYVCHPLICDGKVVGTLSFGTRSGESFEEEELALMQAVTDQAAIALQRKRSEEELVEAKEGAEAASRTKSQFLANMSHELRTPMTGILGMIELALDTPLDPQQREFLEAAQTSARSLVRILNDILDLTRVRSGKMPVEPTRFSLRECLEGVANLMLPVAKKKGLHLGLVVPDDVPEAVVGDEVRLVQVLTNLASNAVKFTDSGSVELSLTVGAAREDGRREVTFAVKDTGIGIAQEEEGALFNPFFQADVSHTRRHGGTGLGLAICREIAELLGGSITLQSEVGRGSSFYFTVVLAVPEEACHPAPTQPGEGAPVSGPKEHGTRILVVDDDHTVCHILSSMLEQMEFVVDTAATGRNALEMVDKLDYDVILMDVQMPVMDGFAATRAIREMEANEGRRRTPIIAVTAHAFKEDEGRCLAAGMDAYLPKPVDFLGALQLINRLLENRPGHLRRVV